MEDDLPKSIVVILVVLAVSISVLGTLTVMHEVKMLREPVHSGDNIGKAKVSLTIENPDMYVPKATGKVTLTVEDH
jgi:hypothetical protein